MGRRKYEAFGDHTKCEKVPVDVYGILQCATGAQQSIWVQERRSTGRLACGQVVPPRGRESPPGDQATQESEKERTKPWRATPMRGGWRQKRKQRKLRRDCPNMVNTLSVQVPRQLIGERIGSSINGAGTT